MDEVHVGADSLICCRVAGICALPPRSAVLALVCESDGRGRWIEGLAWEDV